MDRWDVQIDEGKLWKAINDADGTQRMISDMASDMASMANALGSGFRTKRVSIKGKKVGGTQPRYASDAKKFNRTFVGIVHPINYAAMKDNHLHNTLLKSMRKG